MASYCSSDNFDFDTIVGRKPILENPKYDVVTLQLSNPECSPFRPRLDALQDIRVASLKELCCYVHGIDYKLLSGWRDEYAVMKKSLWVPDSKADELKEWGHCIERVYRLECAATIRRAESNTNEFKDGMVRVLGELEFDGIMDKAVDVDSFIEWADNIKLPLPKVFMWCRESKADNSKCMNQLGDFGSKPANFSKANTFVSAAYSAYLESNEVRPDNHKLLLDWLISEGGCRGYKRVERIGRKIMWEGDSVTDRYFKSAFDALDTPANDAL